MKEAVLIVLAVVMACGGALLFGTWLGSAKEWVMRKVRRG